jgi:hypothetical protein
MIKQRKKGISCQSISNQMDFVSTKEAKQWRFMPSYGNDLAQSYRLYTLALADHPICLQ